MKFNTANISFTFTFVFAFSFIISLVGAMLNPNNVTFWAIFIAGSVILTVVSAIVAMISKSTTNTGRGYRPGGYKPEKPTSKPKVSQTPTPPPSGKSEEDSTSFYFK